MCSYVLKHKNLPLIMFKGRFKNGRNKKQLGAKDSITFPYSISLVFLLSC